MQRNRGEERVKCIERVTWKLTLPYCNQAREVLEKMWDSGMSAADAAAAMGFKKTDTNALDAVVAQVLEENPDMVEIVKGGNMKLINALTGKVMKVSNPKPNPKMVTEIILAKLGL